MKRSLMTLFYLCFLATACDESSAELAEEAVQNPVELLFAAHNDSQISVIRVSPYDGSIMAFDEPVPEIDPSGFQIERMFYNADRSRVALQTSRTTREAGPSRTFWVSEGKGWRKLAQDSGEAELFWSMEPLPNLDFFWLTWASTPEPSERKRRSQLVDFEGTVHFEEPDFQDWDAGYRFVRFGPEAAWVTYTEDHRKLFLREMDTGTSRAIYERSPEQTGSWSPLISAAFETSLVLREEGGLLWLDLEGQDVAPAGFLADTRSVRGTYQISDDTLWTLEDRALVPTLDVSGMDITPSDIRFIFGADERFAVMELDGFSSSEVAVYQTASDSLSVYTPNESTQEPPSGFWPDWREQWTHVVASSINTPWQPVVIQTRHSVMSGDVYIQVESVVEVLRLDADGHFERFTIHRTVADPDILFYLDESFYPQISTEGRYILWPKGGVITRFDVDATASDTLESEGWLVMEVPGYEK